MLAWTVSRRVPRARSGRGRPPRDNGKQTIIIVPILMLLLQNPVPTSFNHIAGSDSQSFVSASHTNEIPPSATYNCSIRVPPREVPAVVRTLATLRIGIPLSLFQGVPTKTLVHQQLTVFANGTFHVEDSTGNSLPVTMAETLPAGIKTTTMKANSTFVSESTVVADKGLVLANVTLSFSIHYNFCQPTGFKIDVIGKTRLAGEGGTVRFLFGAKPDFPVVQMNTTGISPSVPVIAYFGENRTLRLGFDWSDSASLNPIYNPISNGLEYKVGPSFRIDPTTVDQTPNSSPTRSDYQVHTCEASGRSWVFYFDGAHQSYRSTDQNSWTPQLNITTSGDPSMFSWLCSGTTVYYITSATSNGAMLYYRHGTLGANGYVSWSSGGERNFATSQGTIRGISTAIDSVGKWWVAFGSVVDRVGIEVWVCASPSSNPCSWSQSTHFGTQNGVTNYFVPYPDIIPLNASRLAVVWTSGAFVTGLLGARTFTGTTWSANVSASGIYRMPASSCASVDGNAICAMNSNNYAVGYITVTYDTGSPSWGAFASLATCLSSVDCSASMSSDYSPSGTAGTSHLIFSYSASSIIVGTYQSYNSGSTWDGGTVISSSETYPMYVSSPAKLGSRFDVVWASCSTGQCTSPWDLRFASLDVFLFLQCPSGAYICAQYGPRLTESGSSSVTSGCPNIAGVGCTGTPKCTSPSPCFSVQLNFRTTPVP